MEPPAGFAFPTGSRWSQFCWATPNVLTTISGLAKPVELLPVHAAFSSEGSIPRVGA